MFPTVTLAVELALITCLADLYVSARVFAVLMVDLNCSIKTFLP